MKATRLQAYGGPDQFKLETIPDPVPGAGQVLIKVAATGLNPFEIKVRKGFMASMIPLKFPATLGIDVAGTVAAVGPGVTNLKVGDRVTGMLKINGAGSNAEFTVAAADGLALIPASVDFVAAAALPVSGQTGWQAVNGSLQPKKGDQVLVTGALGTVGRTVVFALKQLGATPVAGVRAGREAEARKLGLETMVIGGPAPAAKFDGAVDTIGGEVAASLFSLVKDGGKVATIAGLPENHPKDGAVKAVSVFGKNNVADLSALLAAVGRGDLILPIAKRLPLSDIAEGHRLYEAGNVGGKIVFTA